MLNSFQLFQSTSVSFTLDTEPVAGNYYPVNSRAYIKDDTGIQLTVMTDRSLGCSSIMDGSLELMVHRRLLYNDGTVDGEPLNEPGRDGNGIIVRGRFLILLGPSKHSARLHRIVGEEEYLRPFLSFSQGTRSLTHHNKIKRGIMRYKDFKGNKRYEGGYQADGFRALTRALPANVHLLTLEKHGKALLLRLEHQFAVREDDELSKPVTVSLKGLFNAFTILSVTELNLSADLIKAEQTSAESREKVSNSEFKITLNAMEIKTFKIDVKWNWSRSRL